MNSMVAAYHKTKSSVSNEKDLERQHSKKKAKSFPDQSEPSSPIEEKTVFEDSKISVAVENDTNKVQENAVDIDLEHAEKETEDDSKHDLSDEDSLAVTENQHVVEKSDMDFGPDTTSNGLVVSESGTENAESEQKETKQLFFISPSSVEVAGIISDEKSPIEPPAASSSKQPLLMMRNSSSNAKEKDVMIPAPFAEYVDMNRLHEALSAERVHLYLGHEHVTEEGLKLALKKKDDKSLKPLIRQNHWGADNKIRALLWQLLCKHLHKAHEDDTYDEFAKDMFTPASPGGSVDDIPLPMFVDYSHIECFNLSTEGLDYAKKVTCVIEHTNPDITYCPLLLPLVSLFLHYMDPPTAYNCAYSLLREKEDTYIPQSNVLSEASKFVIKDLTKKYARHCFNHIARNCSSVETFFTDWIWWIFCDLPFPYIVRVIDCFISEGFKVFYRVVLAVLITYTKYHAKKSSKPVPDVLSHLRKFCRELPITVDKLLKVAFSIKGLSRKEIKKLIVKHTMYINSVRMVQAQNEQNSSRALISRSFSAAKAGGLQVSLSRSFSGPVLLQQQLHSSIVEMEMLYAIWTWLPTRYAVCQPLLLYTSEEHGTSLVTLYSRVENYQPTVIVIKNTEDEIFGAFCSAYWRERKQSTKNLSYFGTGETFLFTLAPEKKKYDWVALKEENIPNTANMFQAGDRHVLTVGGGNGEAILLDENLLHCRTERCDTFANDPLCDKKDFTCKVVEVYGFQ